MDHWSNLTECCQNFRNIFGHPFTHAPFSSHQRVSPWNPVLWFCVYLILYLVQIELYSIEFFSLLLLSLSIIFVRFTYVTAVPVVLKESRVVLHLPKGEDPMNELFGIILHGRVMCSLPFIYVIISLYQYGLMGISFILWVIIQFYFIYLWLKCLHFGHWKLFQLAPVSLWHTTPITVVVLYLLYCALGRFQGWN